MITRKYTERWACMCPYCCSHQKGMVSDDGQTCIYECQVCGTFYAVDFSEGISFHNNTVTQQREEVLNGQEVSR